MSSLKGFWSYVHDDDRVDSGRISQLARDVVDEYLALTGEEISLFLDKDEIDWGKNWRDEIDSNLASVAFFIPVITPRYFMSPQCRRELQYFARRANDIGVSELILPLIYIDFLGLRDEENKDELIKLVRKFQWVDWNELRLSETNSADYRRGVNHLANRLVEANKQAEETFAAIGDRMEEIPDENIDEEPGWIDVLANSEEKLLQLPEILGPITEDTAQIGAIMSESAEEMRRSDSQGKGFSARLFVAKRTSVKLAEPIERIWAQSNIYASHLHDVDQGIRILIEHSKHEIAENPDARESYCELFKSVREMSNASVYMVNSIQDMINASTPIEKWSRDLRQVLRRLKQGSTILIEASAVCNEWIELIDASGIDCENSAYR